MATLVLMIERVLVPALLGVGVVSAFVAAGRVAPAVRVTAYSGFWAGVLLTAVSVLIGDALGVGSTTEPAGAMAGLWWTLGGLLGVVAGFGGPISFATSRTTRVVGYVILAQAWGASAALINYWAWPGSRSFTIGLALVAAICSCLVFIIPRTVGSALQDRYRSRTAKLVAPVTNRWHRWRERVS